MAVRVTISEEQMIYLSLVSLLWPNQKKERKDLFWCTVPEHAAWWHEVWVAGTGSSWSHGMHREEAESDRWLCSASSLISWIWGPAHRMISFTLTFHGQAQRFVVMMILNSIKLTSFINTILLLVNLTPKHIILNHNLPPLVPKRSWIAHNAVSQFNFKSCPCL